MQRGETAEEEKLERNEETELNGVDEMSDGEGDEIDGEDWRVRAGPSNKPTQREREEHIRTIKCHIESRTQEPLSDDSPVIPCLVEHARCILSSCQKGRDGRTPFERLHGKKPTQEFVSFGEKVRARQITSDPRNRMNPRYQCGVWLGTRNNSAEWFRWCV